MRVKMLMAILLIGMLMAGTACTTMPSGSHDVSLSIDQKLIKTFQFVINSVTVNGANFSATFPAQFTALLTSCLDDHGLTVREKGKEISPAFTYYIDASVYEFDYMRDLTSWYSTHIVLVVRDDYGNVLATVNCVADAVQSAASARYLARLLESCIISLKGALTRG